MTNLKQLTATCQDRLLNTVGPLGTVVTELQLEQAMYEAVHQVTETARDNYKYILFNDWDVLCDFTDAEHGDSSHEAAGQAIYTELENRVDTWARKAYKIAK